MLIYLQLRPIDDADIFTQITLGKLLIKTGHLITTEPFVFWRINNPISNPGWLAQLLFAGAYQISGFSFVKILHSIIFASAFTLIARTYRKVHQQEVEIHPLAILFGTLLAFFFVGAFMSVRPQVFSLIGTAFIYSICSQQKFKFRHISSLIALAIIWQNTHASVVVGLVVVICFLLEKALSRPFDVKKSFMLLLTLIILSFVVFITPAGISILNISTTNLEISRRLLQISEWMPIWHNSVRGELPMFWPILVIVFISFFAWPRSFRKVDIMLVVLFTCLSLYSARFCFYLGLFLIGPLTTMINMLYQRIGINISKKLPHSPFVFILFLALIAIGTTFCPSVSPSFPHAALRALNRIGSPLNVFNYREWGGVLTFYTNGNDKVFIDGRLYLYPHDIWKQYYKFASGDEETISSVLNSQSIDALLLHKLFFRSALPKINKLSDWKIVFEDEQAIAFMRSSLLSLFHTKQSQSLEEDFPYPKKIFRSLNLVNSLGDTGTTDFVQYWTANQLFKEGKNAYNGEEMLAIQKGLGLNGEVATMMWNPPWLLVMLKPILDTKFTTSAQLWLIINFLLFIVIAILIWQKVLEQEKFSIAYVLSLLSFYPLWSCLGSGQIGILLASTVTIFVLCFRNRHYILSGMALAPLTVKPHLFYLFVPFAIYGLFTKIGRLIAVGFFSCFAIMLIITEYFYSGAISTWFQTHSKQLWKGPFISPLEFQPDTLVGILRQLYLFLSPTHNSGTWLMWLFPSFLLICTNFLLMKNRPLWSLEKYFCFILCLSMFTSPYGWSSDQVILIFPLLAIVSTNNKTKIAIVILGSLSIAIAATVLGGPLCFSWFPLLLLCLIYFLNFPKE